MRNKRIKITLGVGKSLAYAENRSQDPARLRPVIKKDKSDPLAMHKFKVVSGDPSYITYADGSQIIGILRLIAETFRQWRPPGKREPYIVIAGKHGNPCGAAVDWQSPIRAIRKALMGDYVAVMGGEVVTNFPIGEAEAKELFSPQPENDEACEAYIGRNNWGLDVVFAPSFSRQATAILGKRDSRRLLANKHLTNTTLSPDRIDLRPVIGGFLEQAAPTFLLEPSARSLLFWENETVQKLFSEYLESLIIAWAVCWRASSNTVALAKNGMLIGLGCGQQDRIACVRLCIDRATRAGHDTLDSVFASDAFFPYAAGTYPGEKDIKEFLNRMKMLYLGMPIGEMALILQAFNKIDRREGPELLIDAGCFGGVVPYAGKYKEEVKKLFEESGVTVAFVASENRGFSKHA